MTNNRWTIEQANKWYERKPWIVGCYHWGLVAGKTQTYEPWDAIRGIPNIDLSKWQHDLFQGNLSPYDEEEIAIFKRLTDRSNFRKTI